MKIQAQTASEVKNSSRTRTLTHETRKNKVKIVRMLFIVAVIAFVAGGFASCQQDDFLGITPETSVVKSKSLAPDEFEVLGKTYKIPTGKFLWEAQLDLAIEQNYYNLLVKSKLKLNGYKYIRHVKDINDLEKIKSALIDKNTLIPVAVRRGGKKNVNIFELQEAGDDKDWYKLVLDGTIPISEKEIFQAGDGDGVYIFRPDDLKILELEWSYKGKTLHTACLVSDTKGGVYDNFISHLSFVFSISNETIEYEVSKTVPRLKSGNENNNDCGNQTSFSWSTTVGSEGKTLWRTDWRAKITMSVSGSCDNGNKSISSYSIGSPDLETYTGYFANAVACTRYQPVYGTSGSVVFTSAWIGGNSQYTRPVINGNCSSGYYVTGADHHNTFGSHNEFGVTPGQLY